MCRYLIYVLAFVAFVRFVRHSCIDSTTTRSSNGVACTSTSRRSSTTPNSRLRSCTSSARRHQKYHLFASSLNCVVWSARVAGSERARLATAAVGREHHTVPEEPEAIRGGRHQRLALSHQERPVTHRAQRERERRLIDCSLGRFSHSRHSLSTRCRVEKNLPGADGKTERKVKISIFSISSSSSRRVCSISLVAELLTRPESRTISSPLVKPRCWR